VATQAHKNGEGVRRSPCIASGNRHSGSLPVLIAGGTDWCVGPCGVTRLWQFQVYIDDSLRAGQSWVAKSVAGGLKIPSMSFFPRNVPALYTPILSPDFYTTNRLPFLQSSRSARTAHPSVSKQRKGCQCPHLVRRLSHDCA
jgi:hypothetical protein